MKMDKKKQQSKSPRQGSRLTAAEQQAQLAIAQQLGIPPEFLDPSLMGYGGLPSGMDPQQLLNPMAAAASGYPFMNPAALQAFAGLGALGGQSASGATEWWNLAQNQALAASLGAGFYPGMMSGFPMLSSDTSQKSAHDKLKKESRESHSRNELSPRPGSSSASASRSQHDRKKSNESMNSASRERPDSHHSASSPFRSSNNAKQPGNSSWMDGVSNQQQQQKLNEQVLQAEIMRQLEQQFLVQQLQLQQQQQQQDQITAALQSVMAGSTGNLPGTSSHKKGSSDAEKLQQQMAMMMQLMQTGAAGSSSLQGMNHAMSSLFSTPGALETMMAMSQMGNMNALAGLGGGMQNSIKSNDRTDNRNKNSPSSSSYHRSSMHSPSKTKQYVSSASPSSSKSRVQSSSPRKSQRQTPESSAMTKNSSIPGLSGIPGAELSPDNALLAALYSQQLQQQQQYEALIKQELEAMNKLRSKDATPSSTSSKDSKPRSRVKQEPRHDSRNEFFSPSSQTRSNLYSPANSTSSRGKAHLSPQREYSKSPSRKLKEPERSHSRSSSSSKHISPSVNKQSTSKDHHRLENVSETLKLFSALASNPNLTQQELAALLSIPNAAEATALLSGMGGLQLPGGNALLDPTQAANQMTPTELEKLNKDIAAALAFETQRLQEQLRQQQLQMENNHKKGKDKDNRISVIHQNNTPTDNVSDKTSSSRDKEENEKRNTKVNELKKDCVDAASSDGDVASEKNGSIGSSKTSRKRRRIISGDDEVNEPLKHDWKREVRFKFIGNQLRGEVIYTSPSGKKFRTYPEILKHLEENNTTHLQRNNFSFSSRLKVGSFYEQKEKDKGNRQWMEMTEEELEERIQLLDRSQNSSPLPDNFDQMSDYSSSSKAESKSSKVEKEKEREKQKEQLKLLQEQEKLQKLEQEKIEREVQERLALEERQRAAEAYEREQRRQQMLLIRALESRKRAEEREKRREEIRLERIREREKKMEQRRIAMQIARELKMPVEDMATIGAPDLPHLTRLQGTYDNKCPHQLSGNATADLLMVLEFVKTFKECLKIEESIVPTFEQLQLGLLNDPNHTTSIVKITMSLLHQCLCDPGVPAPGPWLHCLTGVKITDIDVGVNNYSEILRLFIWARSNYKTEIAQRLETIPFLSLTTDEKAQCLAFLVNELVCSRPICMEIEKNIDNLSTLRRDKWIVEGQMRQLRVARERNLMMEGPIIKLENPDNPNPSVTPTKAEPPKNSWEAKFQEKMEELTQLHNSYNTQLTNSLKPLRALDLGQDRYKRRYWVLPNLGGVYVEGLESGISYEDDDESPDEDEDDDDDDEKEEISKKTEKQEEESDVAESESVKEDEEEEMEEEEEEEEPEPEIQEEKDESRNEICKVDPENAYLDDQSGTMKVSQPVLLQDSNGVEKLNNAVILDAFTPEDANKIKKASSGFLSSDRLVNESDSTSAKPDKLNGAEVAPFLTPVTVDSDPLTEQSGLDNKIDDHLSKVTNMCVDSPIDRTAPFLSSSGKDSDSSYPIQNGNSKPNSRDAYDDSDPVGDFDLCDNIDEDTRASSGNSRSCTPEPDSNTNSYLYNAQSESNVEDDTSQECTNSPLPTSQADSQKPSTAFTHPVTTKESTVKLIPQPGLIKNSSPTKAPSTSEEDNDSVLAAAKAIAAKAVASSSHLLFPEKQRSPTKSKSKTMENDVDSERDKDREKSEVVKSDSGPLPLGEHTINALVKMGVNPVSLTSQQLEALTHLDVPTSAASEKLKPDEEMETSEKVKEEVKSGEDKNIESSNQLETESVKDIPNKNPEYEQKDTNEIERKNSEDQDIPMDLTCQNENKETQPEPEAEPFPVPKTLLAAAEFPMKLEHRPIPGDGDSPYRDSPDSKYGDSKYFVPINFSNDMKMEADSYNQMLSSRSSPNTLANYIVSSANYSDFQSLDDIKFPIRAPDVKEEPDVIPREKKRGWWRIESMGQLRKLSEKLHLRGIREKQLHRNITKNFEVCTNSMEDSAVPEHKFAVITVEKPKKEPEIDEKLTDVEKIKKTTRSSSQERKTKEEEEEDIASRFVLSEKLAFEAEMNILNQVEELATRCVDMAVVSTEWSAYNPLPSEFREDLTHVPLHFLRDETGLEIKFDASNSIQHDEKSALGAAVDYLGALERAVCRRFLKPPLVRKGGASEFSSLPSLSDGAMDVAHGLRIWRNAVASSSSAAQLSLCIRMLESCIAWDRSATQSPVKPEVLPATKAKKRKGDKRGNARTLNRSESPAPPKKKRRRKTNTAKNAASSANAENKKTKHSRMPIDTADVISKSATADENIEIPFVNGDTTNCDDTSETAIPIVETPADIDNLQDSVASADSSCDFPQNNGQDYVASPVPEYHTNSDNVSEEYRPASEPKKKKKKKKSKKSKSKDGEESSKPSKSKPRKRSDKETMLCRNILRELQSHEAATWFLFPVDCKLVPGYRKIIKKPIDFHTIEGRLKRGRYKSREDFVAEVRLVFDNCQKFNEDDSNIGRAGHEIRKFFEMRWAEIMKEKYGETVTEPELNNDSPACIDNEDKEEIIDMETEQNEDDLIPESTEEIKPSYQSYNDSSGSGGLVIDDS